MVASATIAAPCGESGSGEGESLVSGDGDSGTERAGCPQDPPVEGTVCLVPEGTACDFGGCGSKLVRCTRGVWRYGKNPTPSPVCPPAPPEGACPPCWPEFATCTYGSVDCDAPDASVNTAVASCVGGLWDLVIRPCRDGGDDSGDGGGPDVQGDGGPDAD
ncbi:hypothetical protein [Labilithrix luteola]|uniref:hypothetical protein n=1 Tax=Labilithrix luteola TaxID=1391654 RepID=UPI0011BA83BE|nr:hypothetical protein [Labilithrix luteola]